MIRGLWDDDGREDWGNLQMDGTAALEIEIIHVSWKIYVVTNVSLVLIWIRKRNFDTIVQYV